MGERLSGRLGLTPRTNKNLGPAPVSKVAPDGHWRTWAMLVLDGGTAQQEGRAAQEEVAAPFPLWFPTRLLARPVDRQLLPVGQLPAVSRPHFLQVKSALSNGSGTRTGDRWRSVTGVFSTRGRTQQVTNPRHLSGGLCRTPSTTGLTDHPSTARSYRRARVG